LCTSKERPCSFLNFSSSKSKRSFSVSSTVLRMFAYWSIRACFSRSNLSSRSLSVYLS
jgi:hypothetical protein